jgi:hypothetical protein
MADNTLCHVRNKSRKFPFLSAGFPVLNNRRNNPFQITKRFKRNTQCRLPLKNPSHEYPFYSAMDGGVTNALVWSFYEVKTPMLKNSKDAVF